MTVNVANLAYFERWVDPAAESILAARPEIHVSRLRYADPVAHTMEAMRAAHGYQISPRTELTGPYLGDAALLAQCPDLLAICSTGAGFDMVDVEACTAAGVIVCNQSGSNDHAVAEHALAMMLSLAKKIAVSDKVLRRGGDPDRFKFRATDIEAKVVGIVGLGKIGSRVAQLCGTLFGMRLIAYDPYVDAATMAGKGVAKVGLDALLAQADFVTVHCPRSDETFGMFTLARFRQMRPDAYFINTARGGIHVEDDLADALTEGAVAGAGLDVFLHEPAPLSHRLLAFENVIATPHLAGMTDGAMRNMATMAADQWIGLFAGARPPRLVNPAAWSRYAERFARIFGFTPGAGQSGV